MMRCLNLSVATTARGPDGLVQLLFESVRKCPLKLRQVPRTLKAPACGHEQPLGSRGEVCLSGPHQFRQSRNGLSLTPSFQVQKSLSTAFHFLGGPHILAHIVLVWDVLDTGCLEGELRKDRQIEEGKRERKKDPKEFLGGAAVDRWSLTIY